MFVEEWEFPVVVSDGDFVASVVGCLCAGVELEELFDFLWEFRGPCTPVSLGRNEQEECESCSGG